MFTNHYTIQLCPTLNALFLQLLGEIKLPPSDVRSKYDRIARKKRDEINRDLQKEREKFTQTERKARDEFLKKVIKDAFKSLYINDRNEFRVFKKYIFSNYYSINRHLVTTLKWNIFKILYFNTFIGKNVISIKNFILKT